MNMAELREKNIVELRTELVNLLKEQFNLRIQRGMGEKPKSHCFTAVRRDIARVKTIMNEKGRQ